MVKKFILLFCIILCSTMVFAYLPADWSGDTRPEVYDFVDWFNNTGVADAYNITGRSWTGTAPPVSSGIASIDANTIADLLPIKGTANILSIEFNISWDAVSSRSIEISAYNATGGRCFQLGPAITGGFANQLELYNPDQFVTDLTAGRYYWIKAIIDTNADTFDLYVNGTLKINDRACEKTFHQLEEVRFNDEGFNGNLAWVAIYNTSTRPAAPNVAPTLSSVVLTPTTIYANDDIHCRFTPYDSDIDNVNVSITWFKNISGTVSKVNTYNYTVVNPSLGVVHTTTAGAGSYTGTTNYLEQYRCQANVTDGLLSNTYNTSWINVSNPINSNLSLYSVGIKDNFNVYVNATSVIASVCGVYTNNSNLTCTETEAYFVPYTYAIIPCTISGEMNTNVTFIPYCDYYNGTPYSIYTDNVLPIIAQNFVNNSYYFFENITAQFNFSDAGSLFRWNVTMDNANIAGAINPAYDSYSYNFSYSTMSLKAGKHNFVAEVADGHTAKKLKHNYDVEYPILARNEIKFIFPDENYVNIVPNGKKLFDGFSTYRLDDRYRFTFDPQTKKQTYEFTVTSKEQMYIVNRENTVYKKWIVTGENWLDFYIPDSDAVVDYTQINPTEILVTVDNVAEMNQLEFNSVGDLNVVTYNFTFYTINATAIFDSLVLETKENNHQLIVNITDTNYTYNMINATLTYNGTKYTTNKTSSASTVSFTKIVTAPQISQTSEIVNFTWNITVLGQANYLLNLSHTVTSINIDNCSNASWAKALYFYGKSETDLLNISDVKLNVNFDIHLSDYVYGSTNIKNFTFAFDGRSNYSICIYPNTTTYTVDAIMEYGDVYYTDRKYYLNNYTLDNVTDTIILYHLNSTLSSDIILTVIDEKDGTRLPNSFIKILRYYPGTNTYATVEIERTDSNGDTLAKMILADVFYKFIVERPPGHVILNSNVEKIKTTEKTLPVNTASNPLAGYYDLLGINYDVSCTKSTKTCRFTWNNPSNTAVTGRLTIYQDTGYSRQEYYREELTSAAGSIVYTFPNITNRIYIAEGSIIS